MESVLDSVAVWIVPHLLSILGFLLAVTLVVRLMREHRPPGSTLAWVLSIVLIPYVGVPLYLLIGRRKLPHEHAEPPRRIGPPLPGGDRLEVDLVRLGLPPLAEGRLESLPDGETAYRRLLELVAAARDTIEVSTFILGRDEVGAEIVGALAERARAGVRVRLLLDALGCRRTRRRFVAPLREAGGRVGVFLPVLPLRRRWSAHLRNHRKLVVVDGSAAIIGGRNLAREYMGPEPLAERWEDFGVVVDGPSAVEARRIFGSDWRFATGEELEAASGEERPDLVGGWEGVRMQVVASGPDVPSELLRDSLLGAMLAAEERIWIVTPYFVPDEIILGVLTVFARQGKDVRLVVPARSNHPLADLARESSVRLLLEAGASVYHFGGRMMHAKMLIVDDTFAATGSANLDMRSLYLNYESSVFVHSDEHVARIRRYVEERFLGASRLLEPGAHLEKPAARLFLEDVARLASPLL